MLSFTLDTNCIIAIDESRSEAEAIKTLVGAHLAGQVRVALVAISASERQKDQGYIKNYSMFLERLRSLGLGDVETLKPTAYWDVTFFDYSLPTGPEMTNLERSIHEILFPTMEFRWKDYCA